ncbi:MAG: hypothetical protein JAZ19_16150 [Candidatus Thiodiazotropha taylori]|nr:hypothetical protein [Candidatus Thiodiazotropha taylori]
MDERQIFRDSSTTEIRTCSPFHYIDPGLINQRKIFSIFGATFLEVYDKNRSTGTDHLSALKNDHLLVSMCIDLCKNLAVKSLSKAIIEGPGIGQLVCSTEQLHGNENVWSEDRCRNKIVVPFDYTKDVYIEYSTEHIFSSTTKSELSEGTTNSLIGEIRNIDDKKIVIHPLIIGAPTYDHPRNNDLIEQLVWSGWDQYEVFPEDIKEFSQIKYLDDTGPSEWVEYMRSLPEQTVKEKIAEILGDTTKKDWGGELNDHFSANLTLGHKRTTGAFLLKGPARFEEMQPRHLGKNADQIYRLSNSPANLLVVQHCHTIGEAVRATLRAFAVTPHDPRYYCLLDGQDTFRLLKAYGKI